MSKTDLKSLEYEQLQLFVQSLGEPGYRAGQIYGWLCKGVDDFADMKNIGATLREKLEQSACVAQVRMVRKQTSELDRTTKYLFQLSDGRLIETVAMFYRYGMSVCVSTQVGCRMGCRFCASSYLGFERNLTAGEILGQITAVQRDQGERASRIVLMGIGEPLDNFDEVTRFLRLVSDPRGLHVSLRHITISTCGLVDQMHRLMELSLPVTLSVSLHAPNDEIRRAIMPIARKYDCSALMRACRAYAEHTRRRITFEYTLISGVNDKDEHAEELARQLSHMLCHVNLIPVNQVSESGFQTSGRARAEAFRAILERRSVETTIRREMGADISAACGQLRRTGHVESRDSD